MGKGSARLGKGNARVVRENRIGIRVKEAYNTRSLRIEG